MKLPAGVSPDIMFRSIANGVSTGLYIAGSAVFFSVYLGLSAASVGAGLTVSGIAAMALRVPFGVLADRFGSQRIWLLGTLSAGMVFCAYPFVRGFWWFVVTVTAEALAGGLARAGARRYIGDLLPAGIRVKATSFLQAASNAGMVAGTLIATAAIAVDTPSGYVSLVVVSAVATFAEAGLIAWAVPRVGLRPAGSTSRRSARASWRDRPFVVVAVLNGVCAIRSPLLSVIVPLWVVARTDAPPWVVSAALLVNMAMTILLQVPASRSAETAAGAAIVQRRAAWMLAASCVIFATTYVTDGAATILGVVVGVVALTVGELFATASSSGLGYAFAPDERRGEYLALQDFISSVARLGGRGAFAGLVVTAVPAGWLVMAALFVVTAVVSRPVTAWASRSAQLMPSPARAA